MRRPRGSIGSWLSDWSEASRQRCTGPAYHAPGLIVLFCCLLTWRTLDLVLDTMIVRGGGLDFFFLFLFILWVASGTASFVCIIAVALGGASPSGALGKWALVQLHCMVQFSEVGRLGHSDQILISNRTSYSHIYA